MLSDLEEYRKLEKQGFIRRCPNCGSLKMEPLRFDDKESPAVLYCCHSCEGATWFASLPKIYKDTDNGIK